MTTGVASPAPALATLANLGLEKEGSGQAALFQVSIAMAQQYPRDPESILRQALKELDAHPEHAMKSLYSIPYEDRRGGTTTKVEGLTVRAAEALGALWRHLRIGVRITGEDKDGYDIEAAAWDMQNNYQLLLPYRVSKWETPRGGQGGALLLGEQRMLQRLQAGISKVRRNVTLAMLPAHVKATYEKRVREHLAGGPKRGPVDLNLPADADTVRLIEESFAEYEIKPGQPVSLDDLARYVEKPVAQWTGQEVSELRALFQSITDKETTVAEAFRVTQEKAEGPTKETVVTPDSINQGAARGRNTPPAAKKRTENESAGQAPKVEPTAAPTSVSDDDLQAALDTIEQCESEDKLNDITNHFTGDHGIVRRASRPQKAKLMDAMTRKRASFN